MWPRAAVFDCDGLLVHTARCWRTAYHTVARTAGNTLDGIDLAALDGASVSAASAHLSTALGRAIPAAALGNALQHAIETQPLHAMPGAVELVSAMATELPLAVASNAPLATVRAALQRAGLSHLLPVIVSAEETDVYKPAPEVYLRACQRLGVDPSDAIAFEDSAVGARAARAAGLTVIVVPSSPAAARYADLTVSQMNDPRVHELFGLRQIGNRRTNGDVNCTGKRLG